MDLPLLWPPLAPSFLPGGKICRSRKAARGHHCFALYRPILKCIFPAAPTAASVALTSVTQNHA